MCLICGSVCNKIIVEDIILNPELLDVQMGRLL